MSAPITLGLDLGGTKIEAALVRHGEGAPEVLQRRRVPTDAAQGYDHVLDAVCGLVRSVQHEAKLAELPPLGVGMPGSFRAREDGQRVVKNSNTVCLNERPFFDDLRRALARDVAFANDANCFALAEARWGAARGARVSFGVILGTGVGGGVVFGGPGAPFAWEGAQGIAGEWGHNVLDEPEGLPCYCGKRGCVETWLSGPALQRRAEAHCGAGAKAQQLEARAEAGDDDARRALQAHGELLGRALAAVVNVLDPEVIVLGGGLSQIHALYTPARRALREWVFNDELRTELRQNQLGDSAGVLGAACLPLR